MKKYNIFFVDYYIKDYNVVIEFNGDVFHGNPEIFNENDKPNPYNQALTDKQIWESDNQRIMWLKENYNVSVIVV